MEERDRTISRYCKTLRESNIRKTYCSISGIWDRQVRVRQGSCNDKKRKKNILRALLVVTGIGLLSRGHVVAAEWGEKGPGADVFRKKIITFIDTMKVFDTHEHLTDPEFLRDSYFNDFMLLFHHYYYDDLISAGIPDSLFNKLLNEPLPPREKWSLLKPYRDRAFNTGYYKVALLAAQNLYGIEDINEFTVDSLSARIKRAYNRDWFNFILKDICRFDHVIIDEERLESESDYIHYTKRFTPWLLVNKKYTIDSLAIRQVDPIYSLEDFVRSMQSAFENELKKGMVAVKIILAYRRPLQFQNTSQDAARKVFRTLVNGNEDNVISQEEAKPLQDYMIHRLIELARSHNLPVVIHTGLQAGNGNFLENSNPLLLSNLFMEYPDVNFALFHGSYPFGGELSALAKNFRNVYIDMNWIYAVSPSYSERNLAEWLETVPVGKIMAFGGDYRNVDNVYGELLMAKKVITDVLCQKTTNGFFTEDEAFIVAKMILHDNAMNFYGFKK